MESDLQNMDRYLPALQWYWYKGLLLFALVTAVEVMSVIQKSRIELLPIFMGPVWIITSFYSTLSPLNYSLETGIAEIPHTLYSAAAGFYVLCALLLFYIMRIATRVRSMQSHKILLFSRCLTAVLMTAYFVPSAYWCYKLL